MYHGGPPLSPSLRTPYARKKEINMRGIALLGLVTLGAASSYGDVLYSTGEFDPELAFASDSVSDQFNNQRLAEAFVLSSDSEVSNVQWWGRSEGGFFPDLRNFSTFTVSVYRDAGAIPGAEVFSSTVSVDSVNPTIVGTDFSNLNLYSFDFSFGDGLTLEQGTYWLSVGTQNVDPEGDGFYWLASLDQISGSFAADGGVNGTWNSSGFADLAMTVNGAPVPEPASLAVLGVGAMALLRRRRTA